MAINPANLVWNGVTEESALAFSSLNGSNQWEYTDLTKTVAQLDNENSTSLDVIGRLHTGDFVSVTGSDGTFLAIVQINDPNSITRVATWRIIALAAPYAAWWK